MSRIKKNIFNLFVAILFVTGLVSLNQTVYGQTKERQHLIGTVVSVERETRTLKVRDNESKKIYNVVIPADKQIKLYQSSTAMGRESLIKFEKMMQGLVVDLWVEH